MITKDTPIIEVLRQCPEAVTIFQCFGMGCVGCLGMTMETVENGAKMHNIPIDRLLNELNKLTQ